MAVLDIARDSKGEKLEVGDIVEVKVKYRVLRVLDNAIVAEKVYDVPSAAVTKMGENIKTCDHSNLGD